MFNFASATATEIAAFFEREGYTWAIGRRDQHFNVPMAEGDSPFPEYADNPYMAHLCKDGSVWVSVGETPSTALAQAWQRIQDGPSL